MCASISPPGSRYGLLNGWNIDWALIREEVIESDAMDNGVGEGSKDEGGVRDASLSVGSKQPSDHAVSCQPFQWYALCWSLVPISEPFINIRRLRLHGAFSLHLWPYTHTHAGQRGKKRREEAGWRGGIELWLLTLHCHSMALFGPSAGKSMNVLNVTGNCVYPLPFSRFSGMEIWSINKGFVITVGLSITSDTWSSLR